MSETDRTHALAIGARLRRVRHQQGMSLADVQARSDGRWKAVVVGAYERGDRTVTLSRLADLAEFYDVPLGDLLPDPGRAGKATARRTTLDLVRLDASPARSELTVLARYASRIARKRGDHNGRILTLRAGDLETVALAVDLSPQELHQRLEADGVLLHLDVTGEPVAATDQDLTAQDTATDQDAPAQDAPSRDTATDQDAPDDLAVTIDVTDPTTAPRRP